MGPWINPGIQGMCIMLEENSLKLDLVSPVFQACAVPYRAVNVIWLEFKLLFTWQIEETERHCQCFIQNRSANPMVHNLMQKKNIHKCIIKLKFIWIQFGSYRVNWSQASLYSRTKTKIYIKRSRLNYKCLGIKTNNNYHC